MNESLPAYLSPGYLRRHALDPHATGPKTYTISELAREFDITTRAIRFYESEHLINPARQGRNRLYSQRDHTRLKLILRGKRLGFALTEIREMFALYDSEQGEQAQLNLVLSKVKARRQLLQQQLEDIQLSLHELDEQEKRCLQRLRSL
ncbi:MAG: MerR family DNA-binding transcriptional regulator [Pseudomonadales bacterium]|nr:MerR family DNA-binding transcriptional regulator [Pseudomonadales bacterium]